MLSDGAELILFLTLKNPGEGENPPISQEIASHRIMLWSQEFLTSSKNIPSTFLLAWQVFPEI